MQLISGQVVFSVDNLFAEYPLSSPPILIMCLFMQDALVLKELTMLMLRPCAQIALFKAREILPL